MKNSPTNSDFIFYYNTETNYPKELASSVQRELSFFEKYLLKAIKSMNVEKYGMHWEKDENLTFLIYPTQVLEIKKPRNRIFIKIGEIDFSTTKVIMNGNGEKIEYDTYEIAGGGVILTLELGATLSDGEELFYGRDIVTWESLSSGFAGKIVYLEDISGKRYSVFKIEEKAEFYVVHLMEKDHVKLGTDLFINQMKIDYQERAIKTLRNARLYDSHGPLDYSIVYEEKERFKIRTGRKIEGILSDNTGRRYTRRLEEKKKEDGVWIILEEPEESIITAEDDQRAKTDLFFELIFASKDFEVWEKPDVKLEEKSNRIRIIRTNPEENRLFLEREPKAPVVYPPKNTYQLGMQKNAIQTLMFRPAPEHRNLLRLFEAYDETEWEEPPIRYTERNTDWIFLDKKEREGTDEQREFVLKALNTPDFTILEGPPGSGKTTAISELIYHLLKEKKRILLSASTHVAVDNVIEKLEDKFKENGGPMQNGIVPLRIGREDSISEDVVKYQIEKRKEAIENQFREEKWFKEARVEEKNRFLEESVINASNLICGTTIGILQYPHFRETRHEGYIVPEFDYLIIDEASKTTFQEFLVPAIYAKKWILVGDIRQLSPYTDTFHVRLNLDGILENKAKERALVVFLKLLFGRRDAKVDDRWVPPPKFIYVDQPQVIDQLGYILPLKIEIDIDITRNKKGKWKTLADHSYAFIKKDTQYSTNNSIEFIPENMLGDKRAALFDRDIVFVEEEIYRKKLECFPCTHILIRPDAKIPDIHEYTHLHWHLERGDGKYAYKIQGNNSIQDPIEIRDEVIDSISKDWAGELSWRMKRVQELSLAHGDNNSSGSKGYYIASMRALMPPDDEESRRAWLEIKKIGQVSLTSILTSIQEGITPDWKDKEDKTVMSHGFMISVKKPRYTKLSFQHRMHPDISSIPRELFYRGEALNDDLFVRTKGRDWSFNRYKTRVVWIDVEKTKVYRNTNEKEASVVLEELKEFIKWAKKEKTKYNVIILSFYERQRKLIRDHLRKEYPENGRKETRFEADGIEVRNYTVDKVQGREGDIVILSMVQNQRVGFMDSPNRLNVALTRSKFQLVIVGNKQYFFTQKDSPELKEIAERTEVVNPKR